MTSLLMLTLASCALFEPAAKPRMVDGARLIEVQAWQWGYDPSFITARPGERIRMRIVSLDVAHTITNEELGISTPIPPRGATPVDFEFTVPDAGDYIFHCTADCGPARGQQKMRLLVTPSRFIKTS